MTRFFNRMMNGEKARLTREREREGSEEVAVVVGGKGEESDGSVV